MYFQGRLDCAVKTSGYPWLICGEGRTIVVKAGIGNPASGRAVEEQKVAPFRLAPEEGTTSLLWKEETDPLQIDYLILTRLQMDHCLKPLFFTCARIVFSHVGWKGIVYPLRPRMIPDQLFRQSVFKHLQERAWKRVDLVDEKQEILPGLSVFYTGGHIPCSQAVAVGTRVRSVVLAGDVMSLYGNITGGNFGRLLLQPDGMLSGDGPHPEPCGRDPSQP